MGRQKQNELDITERDRKVISLVAMMKLSEKELFGIECYLAGIRAASGLKKDEQPRQLPLKDFAV